MTQVNPETAQILQGFGSAMQAAWQMIKPSATTIAMPVTLDWVGLPNPDNAGTMQIFAGDSTGLGQPVAVVPLTEKGSWTGILPGGFSPGLFQFWIETNDTQAWFLAASPLIPIA